MLLATLAGTIWLRASGPLASTPSAPPPHSVAVMAFSNLSGDPAQGYFSDGLSEEVINALGRIGGMKVAARLSSFSFKGKPVTIREIARQLDVSTVLEGSVRRDGSRLRITAQLIDARTGYQLWSRDFDQGEGSVLNVQDKIAEAVATSLRITLLRDDVARLASGNTSNPQVLDAYLRGMTLKNQFTTDSLQHALTAFDQAVALDPDFALGHVESALTMINFAEGFGGLGGDVTATQHYRALALAEAERAVSLAPRLGVAHAALAAANEELWRFPVAEAEYKQAKELAPGDSTIERQYARFEAAMGQSATAVEAAQRAVELDPLSAGAYLALASDLALARRANDALTALRHAEQAGLEGPRYFAVAAQIALLKRDYVGVVRLCAGKLDCSQYYLAIADHALGDQAGANAALASFRAAQGNNSAFHQAAIYAQWGDTHSALQWLQIAYRLHDDGLIDMKTYWLLDPIRPTAGYKDIERRMNFSREHTSTDTSAKTAGNSEFF